MTDAYIFIASNGQEFDRYPGEENGYFVDRSARLPYRYKMVSRESLVIVLDSFGEKNILKDRNNNVDDYVRFWIVVFSLAEKVICRVDNAAHVKDIKLNVFVHFGGMEMAVAEALVGKMKFDECLKLIEDYASVGIYSDSDLKIIKALSHKTVNLYPLSSTDPLKRLDVNAPRIALPDSEDGIKRLVSQFDYNREKDDLENVRQGFEKRWAMDISMEEGVKEEYYNCCKALGIVVKEGVSDEQ